MRVCPNDDEVRDAFPMATEEGLKFFDIGFAPGAGRNRLAHEPRQNDNENSKEIIRWMNNELIILDKSLFNHVKLDEG